MNLQVSLQNNYKNKVLAYKKTKGTDISPFFYCKKIIYLLLEKR
ncbi:hypothetical protein SAMN05660206_10992 [Sphingobacterium wenxiniae]|uniref:Uncharacterized protein n=1 Tax=Sphingobacterium wenxiniae TaxID=683125 RepID=A0A1I6ULS8_9SPHI|nr:hypothetical protein SAMN05660206_10992 [Sphingobacterium wenxiniae]